MVRSVEHWITELASVIAGRPVIASVPSLASATAVIEELRAVGVVDVLIVGARRGTGPLPDLPADRLVDLGLAPGPILVEIRALQRALAAPEPLLRRAVDGFDPSGRALVLGDPFNECEHLLGRPFLAFRRPEWVAREDKTTVDAFWDRCGVEREPSEVVGLTAPELSAAAARLDRGHGTVAAADSSSGWHGGASLVVPIAPGTPETSVRDAVGLLAPAAATARMMPFVPGVPCSIHGIVVPGRVVALRPVEMIVLLRPDGGFFYAGSATFFDPPPAVREEMRSIAVRVGEALRAEIGFRGAFTIDGVVGPDGFRPTELNPRNGAGTRPLTAAVGLPFQLLLDVAVAGIEIDWRADELERLLVETADVNRTGATYRQLPVERPAGSADLVIERERVRRTAVGEPPDLQVRVVPGDGVTTVRCTPVAGRIPDGPSFAPIAVAFWAWADREFELGLGELRACGAT